jgi:hypothetical protein
MNEFERMAKIAKIIKNVTPSLNFYKSTSLQAFEAFNNKNKIIGNSITDITKFYAQINNNFPYGVDNIVTAYKNLSFFTDKAAINNLHSIFNAVNGIYKYKTSLFNSFSESNIYSTNYYDYNALDDINTSISQTITELSEKTEFDEKDNDIIEDISNYTYEISTSKKVPARVKKNLLMNIWRNIWRMTDKNRFALLLTVIFFCYQSFIHPIFTSRNTIIKETIREIIIIEKEQKELILRGIIYNGTKIHIKPNTKSSIIFTLDCGDIVEVLKIKKKWVYIKVFRTDIEGWVLKKYTKGNRKNKIYGQATTVI